MTETRIQEFIKEFSDPESFLENAEIVEICKLALIGLRTEARLIASTGQQGSSESRDAEINRLKKELAAANKGAERNAEINRNLAAEINKLRSNHNAHSSHATLIEELVVLKAERDKVNRKLNEALDALGKEKAALNQTLKKYQELEIVYNRLRVKVDAYRMFIEENMEMGHHGLPDYVIRFLKMLED